MSSSKFSRLSKIRSTFQSKKKDNSIRENSSGIVDIDGNNTLHTAAKEGNNSKVKLLLIQEELDIHRQNFAGNDALMLAAYNGHLKVVKNLLAAGADVFAKNNQGETALELANRKNYTEIGKWISNNKTNHINRKKSLSEFSCVTASECQDSMSVNSNILVKEKFDIFNNLSDNVNKESKTNNNEPLKTSYGICQKKKSRDTSDDASLSFYETGHRDSQDTSNNVSHLSNAPSHIDSRETSDNVSHLSNAASHIDSRETPDNVSHLSNAASHIDSRETSDNVSNLSNAASHIDSRETSDNVSHLSNAASHIDSRETPDNVSHLSNAASHIDSRETPDNVSHLPNAASHIDSRETPDNVSNSSYLGSTIVKTIKYKRNEIYARNVTYRQPRDSDMPEPGLKLRTSDKKWRIHTTLPTQPSHDPVLVYSSRPVQSNNTKEETTSRIAKESFANGYSKAILSSEMLKSVQAKTTTSSADTHICDVCRHIVKLNNSTLQNQECQTNPIINEKFENQECQTDPMINEKFENQECQTDPMINEKFENQECQTDQLMNDEKLLEQEFQRYTMPDEIVKNQECQAYKLSNEISQCNEDLTANETTGINNSQTVTEVKTQPPSRSLSFSFNINMEQSQLQKHSSLPNIPVFVQNVYFSGDQHNIAMNDSSLNLNAKDVRHTRHTEEVLNQANSHTNF